MKSIFRNYKNLIKGFFIIFLALVAVFNTVASKTVYADNGAKDLNVTDPLTDLRQDATFDIKEYPFIKNADFELYSLSEYCYSFYPEYSENFALYVYVYNPGALEFKDTSLNRIQMAVGYDKDGNPNDYKKYELKLVNYSKESGNDRLFYKFKVVDDGSIYDRLISTERRYDVSGIELVTEGKLNASESGVSKTFIYTGFSVGYGPNGQAESTLKCDYDVLKTVELKVNHTYWRSKSSNRGVGYQNQLDSVYFTVPNSLLEEYGKLQRIKAEWYEYLTKDIVVTSDEETYNAVKDYIGKSDLSGLEYGFDENYRVETIGGSPIGYYCDWQYNISDNHKRVVGYNVYGPSLSTLYYLFPTANWCDIKEYDPYGDITLTGGVSENALYDYILNFSKNASGDTLSIKDGVISADLFESDIEEYRKVDNDHGKIQNGYSYYDFDADVDIFDWQAYNPDDHKFSENAKLYGFWEALFRKYDNSVEGFDAKNVSPILMLKEADLSGTPESVSNRLFVNSQDVSLIRKAYEEAKKKDETVVLFRFALTDYFSKEIDIGDYTSGGRHYSGQAYRAKQSVFLDFDIIQLTFSRGEELTIIPVVANPIDIVNDITSPTIVSGPAWWETVLAYVITIIASILGLVVAVGVFKILLSIYNGDMHIVGKILFTLPVLAVLALILIYALPWVISTVNGLGGL